MFARGWRPSPGNTLTREPKQDSSGSALPRTSGVTYQGSLRRRRRRTTASPQRQSPAPGRPEECKGDKALVRIEPDLRSGSRSVSPKSERRGRRPRTPGLRRRDAVPFRGSRDRFRPSEHPTQRGDPGRRASGVDEGTVRFIQGCLPVTGGPRPATAFAAVVAVRAGCRAGHWASSSNGADLHGKR
jgi:hypothetical protein